MAYTNAANLIDERLPGHRGPRRPVLRLRPGDRPLRPDHVATTSRPRTWTRTSGSARRSSKGTRPPGAGPAGVAPGGAAPRATAPAGRPVSWKGRRDETLQDPQLRLPDPQAALRPLHPGDGAGGLRHRARAVRAGRRRADQQQRARADQRPLLRRRLDAPQRRRADDPHRRRSCRRCSATSAAPAAGSWRCAATRASRARPTSRPCSTSCPATCRCRTPSQHQSLDEWVADDEGKTGFWGNMRSYAVSLLKSYWGDAATADNDFCFDYLPRITGDHSTYNTVKAQIEGRCKGYFLVGENPAVGSANGKMQRLGHGQPRLAGGARPADDRVGDVLEGRPRDRDRRAGHRGDRHRDLLPAGRLARGEGRLLHPDPADAAVARQGGRPAGRRPQRAGLLLRARATGSARSWPAPPTRWTGRCSTSPGTTRSTSTGEPDGQAVLREINGTGPDGAALSAYTELKADGSTACGCWIYCGVYADEVNQARRRKPHWEQDQVAAEWGWVWPANRRILYNRASAAPDGSPWSERKKYVWWDAEQGKWVGARRARLRRRTGRPTTCPSQGAKGPDAIGGQDPFVMQTDGKAWLFAPLGLADGPMPTHYEPPESPVAQPALTLSRTTPRAAGSTTRTTRSTRASSEVFPYVFTTLPAHRAPHRRRHEPDAALPHRASARAVLRGLAAAGPPSAGSSTAAGRRSSPARTAIEARVLVTDRLRSLRLGDRMVEQVGLPYHWGRNGHHAPATPRTTWSTSPWTPTSTSRTRSAPATSGPAGGRAAPRPHGVRRGLPGAAPGSTSTSTRRTEARTDGYARGDDSTT